jgi:Zn-dependent peptidase ImmA (M78 family)
MKVINKRLEIKLSEFIDVLNNNTDKSNDSERIKGIIIDFVKKNKNKITEKQRKWVIKKLKFIIKKNKMYKNILDFNDVLFINECDNKVKKDYTYKGGLSWKGFNVNN